MAEELTAIAEDFNLIYLNKFGRADINKPTEQHVFCSEHYELRKEIYKDYKVTKVKSSTPQTWCDICTPEDFGI